MNRINYFSSSVSLIIVLLSLNACSQRQQLEFYGRSMQLQIRESGDRSIRITLIPVNLDDDLSHNPVLSDIEYPDPIINIRELSSPLEKEVGNFLINVLPEPLRIVVHNNQGDLIQELTFSDNGQLAFKLDDQPVLGMGEGGPRLGEDWRNDTVEFDRRGRLHKMEPRWQANAYGSRNPVAMLVSTGGWGIFSSADICCLPNCVAMAVRKVWRKSSCL